MAYRVERSEETDRDLEAIFDFLFQAALDFGEDAGTAFERASARLLAMEDAIEGPGQLPHRGTLRPDLADGLWNVTNDRAVIYFDMDDRSRIVRVLAVFHGGQDHVRRMLRRLLGRGKVS